MKRGKREIKSEGDVDKTQRKKDKRETREMWRERKKNEKKETEDYNPLNSEHVNIRPAEVWRGV